MQGLHVGTLQELAALNTIKEKSHKSLTLFYIIKVSAMIWSQTA